MDRGSQFGGLDDCAKPFFHYAAGAVVVQAYGGQARAEGFQQGQAVAFVAGREDVQIGQGEEGSLSFSHDIAGEHDFGAAEFRGFRFEDCRNSYGLCMKAASPQMKTTRGRCG